MIIKEFAHAPLTSRWITQTTVKSLVATAMTIMIAASNAILHSVYVNKHLIVQLITARPIVGLAA